ncbi:nodulation protein NfeD [candidate division KSB1 bacterium]|nr:nodulation protein NfeD [candidate division KSB1 bacterium]
MTKLLLVLVCLSGTCGISLAAHVEWLVIDGAIGPVAHKMVGEAIERAERTNAEVLVIEMDTPGGLLSTTRLICKEMLAARTPVVVYVSPSGARAGSAGVFLTLAAHIAVMAPGTNIGAAHPVGLGGIGGGQDSGSVMKDKITNDAAAFARTLAQQHGRNVDWAERAVRESISATEQEALAEGVIDFIAPSRDSLLAGLENRVVKTESGEHTLHTAGAEIRATEKSLRLQILDFIADPNIAYILLLLGVYGLFFELYNPGSVFPGVVGGLSLILALFSLQLLPFSWAGLLLIGLGILLFALEVKIASYGMLSIGGIIALVLGSFMLFDPIEGGMRVGFELIIPAAIITALFFAFVVGMGLRAQRRKVVSGSESLVGEIGILAKVGDHMKLQVHGELWNVDPATNLPVGTRARIAAVHGMSLTVTAAD